MSYMLRQCCRNGLGKAFHNPSTSCYSNLAGNANAKTPEESKVRGRVPRPSGRLGGVFWISHKTSIGFKVDSWPKVFGNWNRRGGLAVRWAVIWENALCIGIWNHGPKSRSSIQIEHKSWFVLCIMISYIILIFQEEVTFCVFRVHQVTCIVVVCL